MSGLGAGSFMSGLMSSYNQAANRQMAIDQSRRQNKIQDLQLKQIEDNLAREAATNALYKGLMTGGFETPNVPTPGQGQGMYSPEAIAMGGQNVSLPELALMSSAQQKQITGHDLSNADWGKVLQFSQSLQEKPKDEIKLVEMNGPQGYGQYAVNMATYQSQFLGGGKPEPAVSSTPQIDPKGERDLRKEYAAEADYFKKIANSYSTIEAVASDDSAAGDIGLVFSIMKMFDPTSVVRESEFATAANAAGVPDRIRAQWNKLKEGERLAPAQRADFVNTAKNIFSRQRGRFLEKRKFYEGLATAYKYDPKRIVYDFSFEPTGVKDQENEPPADITTDADNLIKKYGSGK